jgi:hypothetical protein
LKKAGAEQMTHSSRRRSPACADLTAAAAARAMLF